MTAQSPLYLLERFDCGIVRLDSERRVLDMNAFARQTLPVDETQPFSRMVLDFHPERSKPKVEFLLDQAAECPVASPPPMTMIINILERVLLIKVSRMSDGAGATTGYTLVFYDITEFVAADMPPDAPRDERSEREPVDEPEIEFLGEIDVSGEDWVALAEAEPVERPAEMVPVTSVKEKDDGKQ